MYISRALAMMSNNKIHLSGSRPKLSFLNLKIPHIQVLFNTFDETAVQEMLSGDLVTFTVVDTLYICPGICPHHALTLSLRYLFLLLVRGKGRLTVTESSSSRR